MDATGCQSVADRRAGFWIDTYSGRRFSLTDPQPDDVCIEDIAHALANLARYVGQTREFYSVAQHSVLVSRFLAQEAGCPPDVVLAGLLHDAAEAYCQDICRPLKVMLHPHYSAIEARIQSAIWQKFDLVGVADFWHAEIKSADNDVLRAEAEQLLASRGEDWDWRGVVAAPFRIYPLLPNSARWMFLRTYRSACSAMGRTVEP